MNELVKHIEAINAKTQKWVDEDPTNRWAGMITTDLEHWKEYGITTPAQYDRYMLEQAVYETHKSAYGVKGRHYDFDNMTDEELKDDSTDEDKKKISELVKSRDLEDKEKQQKDYEDKKKTWQEKLDKEKSFSGTIYEIDSWNAEKFFKRREDLVKKKEEEEVENENAPNEGLNIPNNPGAGLPNIPGTLIPGITPQNDTSEE